MNDQAFATRTISSQSRFPLGAFFFAGLAILFLVAWLATSNPHFGMATILPTLLAIVCFFTTPGRFVVELTARGLVLVDQSIEIPYSAIQSVTLAGRAQAPDKPLTPGAVVVVWEHGVVEIPRPVDIPSIELYRWILSRVPACGSRDVQPELADHVSDQVMRFGWERVWTFRGRAKLGGRPSTRRGQCVGVAMIMSGILCIVAMVIQSDTKLDPWIGFATFAILIGILTWLISLSLQRHPAQRVKRYSQASLVVSPLGIAMVQGDVRGVLEWREVRDVQLNEKSGGRAAGIRVLVEGAVIQVADVYDRPLPIIHSVICRLWRPGGN